MSQQGLRKREKVVHQEVELSPVTSDKDEMMTESTKTQTGNSINPSWWGLLFQVSEGDMYDIYLNFKDKNLQNSETEKDFISFKRSDGNILLPFFFMILLGLFVVPQFLFSTQFVSDRFAMGAFVFGMITALLLVSTLLLRMSLVSFPHDITMFRWLHPGAVSFHKSSYGQYLDDGVVICGALTSGLFLLTHLDSPTCPSAVAFIIVLVFQLVARGVSRFGLVCAWITTSVCININLWLLGTTLSQYLLLNCHLSLLHAISYEIERQPLRQFIISKRTAEAADASAVTLANAAIVLAEDHQRQLLNAKESAEALASTAKVLAAVNETERVAAYSAEKAFATTVKLLSAENDIQKLKAMADAKAAATAAVLLAAANEMHNDAAVELARVLANTGIASYNHHWLCFCSCNCNS